MASLAACSSSTAIDHEDEVAIDRASSNAELRADVQHLTEAGWTVELAQAQVDHPVNSAAGSESWTRVRIAISLAGQDGRPRLAGELLAGWPASGELTVAVWGQSPEASDAIDTALADGNLVADEGARAPETSGLDDDADAIAPAACRGLGTACATDAQCCSVTSGMTCFGADHHETCQCSAASKFTTSYFEAGTVSTVCFVLPDNPSGAAYWIRTRTGCGQGTCRTGKGCGVACPGTATATSKSLHCGIYGGRC